MSSAADVVVIGGGVVGAGAERARRREGDAA
jgi:glycine/D-amino acid oxidase-like deaminating enzyme